MLRRIALICLGGLLLGGAQAPPAEAVIHAGRLIDGASAQVRGPATLRIAGPAAIGQ